MLTPRLLASVAGVAVPAYVLPSGSARAEALRALGCRPAQGWLSGRADPADSLEPTVGRAPLSLAKAVGE